MNIYFQAGHKMLKKWPCLNALALYWSGDKSGVINQEDNIRRALLITRCLVFILTSAFYLAGPPFSPTTIKIGVVVAILIATTLAQNLYDSWNIKTLYNLIATPPGTGSPACLRRGKIMPLLSLMLLETAGGVLLILPTGGLESSFVWYALNPIITAVVYLPGLYCWGTLGLYIGAAIGVSTVYPDFKGPLIPFIYDHLSILLVFFLSTSLAQVAVSLYKRLGQAYASLARAYEVTERSLTHISSLYQALEAFSSREDGAQLVDVLAVYAHKLCEVPAACFLPNGDDYGDEEGRSAILRIADQDGLNKRIDWEQEMSRIWNRMKPAEGVIVQPLDKEIGQLIAVPIISGGEYFGLLAYLQPPGANDQEEKMPALIFLAGIAGIILERLKTDKLWARLLVSEEQNRIANEIHDGVSQYLFSMVCALDTISREQAYLQEERIQEQLHLLEETAHRASRELRASIYQLSPHQRGESVFVDNLASYLDDLGRLNNIQVDLQAEGNEEVLSSALRKALYRIVREASSNAVRHGKCSSLKVCLSMLPNQTVLEIKDNGCGYMEANTKASASWQTGLGKRNMYQLAACFNGDLETRSEPGAGTLVRCTIPKKGETEEKLKEAVNK